MSVSGFARAARVPKVGRLPEVSLTEDEWDKRLGVTVKGDPECAHEFEIIDIQKGCRCMSCYVSECSKCGRTCAP